MIIRKILSACALIMLTSSLAHADLNAYMDRLRVSADANIGDFRASLGAHFGASGAELDHVFLAVGHPSEAPFCFWLSRTTGRPVDDVLRQYRANGKRGWGALAQNLGIKPGSAEFKALKAGQLGWNPPGGYGNSKGGHEQITEKGKGVNHKGRKS